MTRHEEVMEAVAEWRASIAELDREVQALDVEVREQFGDGGGAAS